MDTFEVRVVGTGGNGIILTGLILANATLNNDNLFVAQTQEYSPDSRGGYCKSEIQFSKKEILFPKVTSPNLLATLSDTILTQDSSGLTSDSLIITDDSIDLKFIAQHLTFKKILQFPFFSFTRANFHSLLYTNMVFLGVLSHYVPWVSEQSILLSIKDQMKNKYLESNVAAFNAGTTLEPSCIWEDKTLHQIAEMRC